MLNGTYNHHENFTTHSTLSWILASATVLMLWTINMQNPAVLSPTVSDFKIRQEEPIDLPGVERVKSLIGPGDETILIIPPMAGVPA